MKILAEFKEFAIRGNVIDMMIGIVVGVAFKDIVNSFVNDIIMPPITLLLGKTNLQNLFIDLSGQGYQTLARAKEAGVPVIAYGKFISLLLDFMLLAFIIFLLVKQINKIRKLEGAYAILKKKEIKEAQKEAKK